MNLPDHVAADSATDRPEFSDRGGSVVESPRPKLVDAASLPTTPKKDKPRRPSAVVDSMSDEELMADSGVEPIFSTAEAAAFFDRSNQWLYWGLREGVFTDDDGNPLDPSRIGDPSRGRRRFTIPVIENILRSSYRRGNIDPDHLKVVLRRIKYAKMGVEWREREGWRYAHLGRNRYKWVRPEDAVWDPKSKEWKETPEARAAREQKTSRFPKNTDQE